MPKTLKEFGLIAEIDKHLNLIKEQSSFEVKFEHVGFNERLEETIELELYYITMETLDNILKYANAKNVLIQFLKFENELVAVFEDDGIGFNPNEIRQGANGITNIRNRVTLLYGTTDIYSIRNEGTTITLNIPLGATADKRSVHFP